MTSSEKFIKIAQKSRLLRRLVVFDLRWLDAIEDEKLNNTVVTQVYSADSTSKQTMVDRFGDLNGQVLNYLDPGGGNEIHDIAFSGGQTSYELYRFLKQNAVDFHLSISDKYSKYYVTGNGLVRIYNVNRKFVFGYVHGLLADNNPYINRVFFGTRLLGTLLSRKRGPVKPYAYVKLYCRNITGLIDGNQVSELDYDIFATRMDDRFTFIRCMNILNLKYISGVKMYAAIKNITRSLRENGVVQIGRTVNEVNNASFYRKMNDRLVLLEDVNSGTENKDIIKQYNMKC